MTTAQPSLTTKQSWRDHLRLMWALAAKDIVDALKSKTTLTTLVIALLMVFFYRYYPALMGDDTLRVFVYAESDSPLLAALETSPALAVYDVDSRDQLSEAMADAEALEMGVVIDGTAVADLQNGRPVTLDGYLMYWVSPAQRAELKAIIEDDLSAALDQPVTVDFSGHDVTFNADVFFFAFSSSIALLFITAIIGISVVPNLMVDEKQARTLDALLVSPVSAWHLAAGKALAGLFYGLVGCVVVLAVFGYLIVQWPLAVATAVLTTLFMVTLGLLLGSLVNNRAQLQLVAWFVMIPLFIPVILVALEGLVPSGAVAFMNWLPNVLLIKLFRLSLTPNATLAHYGPALAVVIPATLALLALVGWVVDRQQANS